MLNYNEITPKKFVVLENEPYEVLASHVFRKQQRKPVNQTKIRNMMSGKVTERSFHVSETVEEAEIERKEVTYLYNNRGEYWFCEINDKSKRFQVEEALLTDRARFLKTNSNINLLIFKEKIIGVDIPIKMELIVKEAAPAVKGNTSQGATKQVVLETGATVNTPLFVNQGDIVRVNTEAGEYVERVEKS